MGTNKEELLLITLQRSLRHDGGTPSMFLETLATAIDQKLWEKLGITFEEMIEADLPNGLGSSLKEIEQVIELKHRYEGIDTTIRERMIKLRTETEKMLKYLRKHGANQYTGGPDNNQVLYGTTGKPYIIARLARDHPKIHEDLQRGKYRSARQAGIAAGFIQDVKRIQVLPDPQKIAPKLKERLTPAQITKLIQLLQEEREDTP